MINYQELYLKDMVTAQEISRCFGLLASEYLAEQGIDKHEVYYCDERQCFQTIQVCTICNSSEYCQSIPQNIAKCLPKLISLWHEVEMLTLEKRGVKMAKKKKKKAEATEELPKIKKTKKGKKEKVSEPTITNGDVQTMIKAVKDYFQPLFDSIQRSATEHDKKIDSLTEKVADTVPVLKDMKKIVNNLVGEEVKKVSRNKTENTQVERSEKKNETNKTKFNRKTSLYELEKHLHENDIVLDENDVVKFVAKRVNLDVSKINKDSIKEYIVRYEKHNVPIEDLKVIEYHDEWYAYCSCCFEETEKVVEAIEENYYE